MPHHTALSCRLSFIEGRSHYGVIVMWDNTMSRRPHLLAVYWVCVVACFSLAAGCHRKSDPAIVSFGPPPVLPAADSVQSARWRRIGDAKWTELTLDEARFVLQILQDSHETHSPEGDPLPIGGPISPEIEFTVSHGRTYGVVLLLLSGQFWFGETTAGRQPKPLSYTLNRELLGEELALLRRMSPEKDTSTRQSVRTDQE